MAAGVGRKIFLKKNRIIWAFLWIVSIVGISFWGGSISYGFFATMTLIPILSLTYLLFVYYFFHIYQKTEGRNFTVGETVPYSFSLVNEYFYPFVGVRVRFFSPFSTIQGLSDETEYELLAKTGINKETTMICHYRGEYEVGIKQVEIQDFFRLFRISYKNKETQRVIVNPQLVSLENLGSVELNRAIKDSQVKQTEMDILSREYVLGDDVRFINWNQTARTGNMMTRNRIGEENTGVSVIMDACRYSKDLYEYIPMENKILETTLAVSYYFNRKNISVAEYHYEQEMVSTVVGSDHVFDAFYHKMSKVSFDERNTQERLFERVLTQQEIFESAICFFILSTWSKEAEAVLEKFMQNNVYVVIYLICNDLEYAPVLPDYDRIELMKLSSDADLLRDIE